MPAVALISLTFVRLAVKRPTDPRVLSCAVSQTNYRPAKNWDGTLLHGALVLSFKE